MMYRPASLLAFFALLAVTTADELTTSCIVKQITMNLCVATNVLACGSDCLNGEIETLGSLSSDCSSKDGFCDFSACCPACGTETGAYKECLLDSSCDMDCPAVVPTAPSPASFLSPSEDSTFPPFPACQAEQVSMNLCVATNVLACGSDCLNGEIDALKLLSSDCSSKDGFCDFSACCPACDTEVGAYKECLLVSSCDMDCPAVVPTAPSPAVVPTAPSPASFFPPAFAAEGDNFGPRTSGSSTKGTVFSGILAFVTFAIYGFST